jgi:hypothetical protein
MDPFSSINKMDRGLMDWQTRHFAKLADDQKHRDNPVYKVMDAVKQYVEEFERSLDDDHEVAVRLVSYGSTIVFHAEYISFCPPSVITFSGVTTEGERVQLIQHVTQLSFILKAVPKTNEKPRRIGFGASGA